MKVSGLLLIYPSLSAMFNLSKLMRSSGNYFKLALEQLNWLLLFARVKAAFTFTSVLVAAI